ncbi:MAG: hypothetical protein SPG61_01505, partial [Arcanobacterium sp.]|nr:hypothetical protein [Arcanobacterium sp.]
MVDVSAFWPFGVGWWLLLVVCFFYFGHASFWFVVFLSLFFRFLCIDWMAAFLVVVWFLFGEFDPGSGR